MSEVLPSLKEQHLLSRCLIEAGVFPETSTRQLWGSPLAWVAYSTWRECLDALTILIGGGHGVEASFVKACVMQADGISEVPYCLDEIAEFMVDDAEARAYWQQLCQDDMFPHVCPRCGAAAFVGFLIVECKAQCQ